MVELVSLSQFSCGPETFRISLLLVRLRIGGTLRSVAPSDRYPSVCGTLRSVAPFGRWHPSVGGTLR